MRSILPAALFTLISAFATIPSTAQQFNSPTYYKVGLYGAEPSQIVTGDFNRDGNLDLAVSDTLQGGVALLVGNGDGTFQPAKHLIVSSPYALAVADINGDGNPDLLVQQYGQSGNLLVYLGNGDGTFHQKAALNPGGYPIALAVADFNGDGLLDVVIASSNNDQSTQGYVSVYMGNGNGTFRAGTKYFAGKHPWGVSAADLNGDGHIDLVVSDDNNTGGNNTLFILLNNGTGIFHSNGIYQTGLESLSTSIADLNQDGKLDIVVSSAFDQGIYVLLGHGDATFAAPVLYSTATFGQAPFQTVVADFDGDGRLDIAVIDYAGSVGLFYGNGDGTFQPIVATPATGGGESLVLGDFNKDGKPDIAFTQFVAAAAGVMLNAQ